MTVIDEQGRPEPRPDGNEVDTILGFLEFHRATLAWKSSGLDEAGMTATVGASTMTLGGMLKHLALVENYWFSTRLAGRAPASPWDTVDWEADPDWDWNSAANDPPEVVLELWHQTVEQSRARVSEALAEEGLDQLARGVSDDETPNLRWIIVHMIEEYARHNGHADLIRESIDGLVGE